MTEVHRENVLPSLQGRLRQNRARSGPPPKRQKPRAPTVPPETGLSQVESCANREVPCSRQPIAVLSLRQTFVFRVGGAERGTNELGTRLSGGNRSPRTTRPMSPALPLRFPQALVHRLASSIRFLDRSSPKRLRTLYTQLCRLPSCSFLREITFALLAMWRTKTLARCLNSRTRRGHLVKGTAHSPSRTRRPAE
jgi:hypothetical protein